MYYQSFEPIESVRLWQVFQMCTLMNGILETQQLKIRSEEAPVSFLKELADSRTADHSLGFYCNFIVYQTLALGIWPEIQGLKQDP